MKNKFEQLLVQHQEFLLQAEDESVDLIEDVQLFLSALAKAGNDIGDRRNRSQLRSLIRYWSSYIYDKTNQFPDIELSPVAKALDKPLEDEQHLFHANDSNSDNSMDNSQLPRLSSPSTIDRIGPFEIIDEIGNGGFSRVYKAFDKENDRTVALKIIQDEQFQRSGRFRDKLLEREQIIANLKHPNIIPVYNIAEYSGMSCIAMQLVESGSLVDRLTEWFWRPTVRQILKITSQIADGLSYLHQNNIVHRDVKPANILLSFDDHAYLSDFGIAQIIEGTFRDIIVGTPAYIAPEAILRPSKVDGRADIYSLGIIVYQLLTGKLPFEANHLPSLLYAQVNQPIPPITDVAREVVLIVEKCLRKDPDKRFQDALHLKTSIDLLIHSLADSILDSQPYGFISTPNSRQFHAITKRLSLDDLEAAGLSSQITMEWPIPKSPKANPSPLYEPSRSAITHSVSNCPQCNTIIREGARFCPRCGLALINIIAGLDSGQSVVINDKKTLGVRFQNNLYELSNDILAILLVSPQISVPNNDFFVVRKNRTTIGKSEHNDIVISDTSLSLQHALLVFGNKGGKNQFELYDLASTSGTFVNGKEHIKRILKHNDLIKLGKVEMVFKRLDDGPNLDWWQPDAGDEEE